MKSRHMKMLGIASLTALILVAVAVFIIYAHLSNLATTTTTPVVTISPSLLLNRSNALYGIPNSSTFITNGTPTIQNNVTGASSYMFLTYYSNAMEPLYTMKPAPPLTYNLTVPTAYSSVTYPLSITVTLFIYSNANLATYWFNNYFYNPKLGGSTINGVSFISNHMTIDSTPAVLESYKPIFTHLEEDEVTFHYGEYIITVSALGMNHTFNSTYLINIAKHMYQQISS